MNLPALLAAARTSAWKRFLLNQGLNFTIPFNSPHGFRVEPMKTGGIRVRIPWWHVNRNHIRGMHACALATGAELCSGLSLLEHVDQKQYRLVMASLHMDYHKQGMGTAFAECRPSKDELQHALFIPLETQESARYEGRVDVQDASGVILASATITWQLKKWSAVKTRP